MTAAAGNASALNKRFEVVQEGDFVLIGNTLAHDCGPNGVAPKVGTATCSMVGDQNDPSPDMFWRAEGGAAIANNSITVEQAQTAAVLQMPAGAQVTKAFLYWSARRFAGPDNAATIQCLPAGAAANVQAIGSLTGTSSTYQSVGDVTDYVKTNGACTYLVSGVDSIDLKGAAPENYGYAAWWMVVIFNHESQPHRQLMIFDGLDSIENGGDSTVQVTGLKVPNSFTMFSNAKVGVVGYDGDKALVNDQFFLGMTALKDASNDANNFFNSTRSHLGTAFSVAGDLPEVSGVPGSLNRLDLDTIDITNFLEVGQTTVDFRAVSGGEPVALAGIITSIPTFTDQDGDGLSDDEEEYYGTDPTDKDSDNDGVPDGAEGCSVANCTNPLWNVDSDGDGLINALDPDSDDDGLYDGTELGLDCNLPDTDKTLGHCIPDADNSTKTDPLDADTDDGGVKDGSEDFNLNGKVDEGETDPTAGHGSDDGSNVDSDNDGLSDGLEETIGSDPNDADSDNDGLLDGEERNPADDTDGDGLPNVLDVDSDNDALFDGTEAGKDCSHPDTDTSLGHCKADANPSTTTSPVDADSDNGGVKDGAEDANLNGAQDSGETDPTAGHGADDVTVKDTDGDGLSDELEETLGSNPNDKDSDDDGVPDGEEANPSNDEDGDGIINILDPDSDGDGLFDGTEGGYDCNGPGTNKNAGNCIPDGDKGKTTTSMVDADTDDGGVSDGAEDFDKDGVYDANQGEGNPNEKSDDIYILPCTNDSECGTDNDGVVCDSEAKHCTPGCRNEDGSRCPDGEVCTSTDQTVGECVPWTTGSGGSNDFVIYDGCICGVQAGREEADIAWVFLAAAGVLVVRRKRAA
jgi:hypothetical protein